MHHSAIRPRAFPLGLLAPRCLCAPLILASIACGLSGSGVALVWGEEGILPPAPPHPRSFGFRRRTTPFLVFIIVFGGKFRLSVASFNGSTHPLARTPVAEVPEVGKSMCTCPTLPVRVHPAREGSKGSRAGLPENYICSTVSIPRIDNPFLITMPTDFVTANL